jgi:hypothetical protein
LSTAIEPIFAAREDDPLPADAALHDARDLLDAARQHVRERAHARHADALELERVEQHPDARPVRRITDEAREDRDRHFLEELAAHYLDKRSALSALAAR